ncbi:hypothetical protein OG689_38295 [Kitasatospora sp. NBC_00240]|uniref:hypothetical protein n=1 Tax=Kitasatospora sp. NBC_00240 TaxID=2903567 RepID=UPI002258DC68|nr:hypothetical protein [Kitasatospora sp. NBC_00240]MCX5215046.1 hypothetical protein [Kitasatospora sp. NBC_00240]
MNEGFKITWTESAPAARAASPTGGFEAVHEPDRYTVSLKGGAEADEGVILVVTLPCQAPPAGAASPAPTAGT